MDVVSDCDDSCETCSGTLASECLTCASGTFMDGGGLCTGKVSRIGHNLLKTDNFDDKLSTFVYDFPVICIKITWKSKEKYTFCVFS